MLVRAIPKTEPRRCRLLYEEHDAETLVHIEQLIAAPGLSSRP